MCWRETYSTQTRPAAFTCQHGSGTVETHTGERPHKHRHTHTHIQKTVKVFPSEPAASVCKQVTEGCSQTLSGCHWVCKFVSLVGNNPRGVSRKKKQTLTHRRKNPWKCVIWCFHSSDEALCLLLKVLCSEQISHSPVERSRLMTKKRSVQSSSLLALSNSHTQ